MFSNIFTFLNLPEDRVKIAIALYICLPISFLLKKIIDINLFNAFMRNIFVSAVGLSILIFCFKWTTLHVIACIIYSALLISFFPRKNIGIYVTAAGMLHLSWCHIYRLYFNFPTHIMDITAPMMVVVQRVSLVSFHFQDLFNKKIKNKDENEENFNFMTFISYCMFSPSILVGPSMEYGHYKDFISGKILKDFQRKTNKQAPSIWTNTLSVLLLNVCSFGLFFIITAKFPYTHLIKSEVLSNHGFFYYWGYLSIYMFGERCMYHGIWSLTECCGNLCYAGFGGIKEDGKEDWTQTRNINSMQFETAPNQKILNDSWNIFTEIWLKKCVYLRISPKYNTPITFLTSAFWHGFYIQYYYTFANAYIFTVLSRRFRKTIRPYMLSSKYIKYCYDIFTIYLVHAMHTYNVLYYINGDINHSFIIWRKLYFFGHIFVVIGMLLAFIPIPQESLKKE